MTKQELGFEIGKQKDLFDQKELILLRVLYGSYPEYAHAREIPMNERELRGKQGVRMTTSKKLLLISDWKVIATSKGYKLSNDPVEWQEAERQISAHGISEMANIKHLKEQKEEGLFS